MSDSPRLSDGKSNVPMLGQRPWVSMETNMIKQILEGFLHHDQHYLAKQLSKYNLRPRFLFPAANQMYLQRLTQARAVINDTEDFAKELRRRRGLLDSDYELINEVAAAINLLRRNFPDLKARNE